MKKFLIATACFTMLSGAAFAQGAQPQGSTNVPNPSATPSSNDMSKSGMNSGSAGTTGHEGVTSGTTGSSVNSNGVKPDNMHKGGEAKDGDGMNKGGMSK
ncbi:MAG: hypothetical protein K2W78_02450 [Xanthobacteraceae bacterium]|nr:hypothetical protein [Xanthobacteraceae bacterium]